MSFKTVIGFRSLCTEVWVQSLFRKKKLRKLLTNREMTPGQFTPQEKISSLWKDAAQKVHNNPGNEKTWSWENSSRQQQTSEISQFIRYLTIFLAFITWVIIVSLLLQTLMDFLLLIFCHLICFFNFFSLFLWFNLSWKKVYSWLFYFTFFFKGV